MLSFPENIGLTKSRKVLQEAVDSISKGNSSSLIL